ncbi:MAG: ParA family protein [Rikenellaceae bacterium]|nr:ParA family protein [Rikenellaceae bacterium]
MKVYSFISAKGGSGKTILTATIADFLSQLGKKVLIIDSDGSTNGLTLFYLQDILDHRKNNNKIHRGILEEDRGFTLSDNTVKLSNGVQLIPATYSFNNTDCFNIETFYNNIHNVVKYFSRPSSGIDFILIDCQAGSDHHTEIVIRPEISNEIIIVSEYDPISAAGLERLKGFFSNDLTYERTWTLLNKVLPEFANSNSDFLEISKYLPPVLWDAAVVKKYARKEIALDLEYGSKYTLNIITVLRALMGKDIKTSLDVWIKEKSEIVKQTIYAEYQNLKLILEDYKKEDQKSRLMLSLRMMFLFLLIFSLVLGWFFIPEGYISENNLFNTVLFSLPLFGAGIILASMYTSKMNKVDHTYEKEALIKRIQELEILKHSDPEKILRVKQRENNL